jgi:6,7-dimethyl-8-ribityllumazine synthase
LRLAIVVSEFNEEITFRMFEVAKEKAKQMNLEIIQISKVPGAYDMPIIVDALLSRSDIDAVVTLGSIIKGQTKHDEVIAHTTAKSLTELSLKYQKPVSLGITGPGMQERHAFARIRPISERAVEAVVKIENELKRLKKK